MWYLAAGVIGLATGFLLFRFTQLLLQYRRDLLWERWGNQLRKWSKEKKKEGEG